MSFNYPQPSTFDRERIEELLLVTCYTNMKEKLILHVSKNAKITSSLMPNSKQKEVEQTKTLINLPSLMKNIHWTPSWSENLGHNNACTFGTATGRISIHCRTILQQWLQKE